MTTNDEENLDKYLTSQISKSASDKEMEIGKLIDEATGGYESVSKKQEELRSKIKGLFCLIMQEGVEYVKAKTTNQIFAELDKLIYSKLNRAEGKLLSVENKIKDFELSKPVNIAKHYIEEYKDSYDALKNNHKVDWMKTTDEIIKKCDRLMSTAEVKYTRTHLELAIEEARADERQKVIKVLGDLWDTEINDGDYVYPFEAMRDLIIKELDKR